MENLLIVDYGRSSEDELSFRLTFVDGMADSVPQDWCRLLFVNQSGDGSLEQK